MGPYALYFVDAIVNIIAVAKEEWKKCRQNHSLIIRSMSSTFIRCHAV